MNEVFRAAADLQAFCEEQKWRFCVIGGLALLRWGEPRETVDVDLTLVTGFGREESFIRRRLDRYEGRIEKATEFALAHRVLLLRAASGVGLDIALGGLPFEKSVVQRATPFVFAPDVSLCTCSAEDLIVTKAFAARAKDWLDIEGILIRQTGKLDWTFILNQLTPLVELKGAPEIIDELRKRRSECER